MKTQADNTYESQKSISPKVASEPSRGGTTQLVDNRNSTAVQRKLQESMSASGDEDANPIQRKTSNTGLPDNLKSGIENLSGYSMDDVKVHYNSSKPAQLQAHAYAQGTDIHLASGQEKHLPHEAWHVVQQKQGRVKPTKQLKSKFNINDDAKLEKEADVMGARALHVNSGLNSESALGQNEKSGVYQNTKAIQRNVADADADEVELTEEVGVEGGLQNGNANTPPDPGKNAEHIKALITREFNVQFEGDWSVSKLRRTYFIFHSVPKGTVEETVSILTRNWSPGGIASTNFGQPKITMGKLIPSNITMGSVENLSRVIGSKFLKKSSPFYKKSRSHNAWDHTLLHEIGHTVDFKRKIMDTYGSREEFGGWESYSGSTSLASSMISNMRMQLNFPNHDENEIKAMERFENIDFDDYMKNKVAYDNEFGTTNLQDFNLNVKFPETDKLNELRETEFERTHKVTTSMLRAGIKAASEIPSWAPSHIIRVPLRNYGDRKIKQAVESTADYAAMSKKQQTNALLTVLKHPAIKMIRANRKGESHGAWQRNEANTEKLSHDLGGRYYQFSYPAANNKADGRKWTSFQVSSKRSAVSHYQYRAPGEWFAEMYAFYYQGSLDGHPLKNWFDREIDIDLDPNNVENIPADPGTLTNN